MTQTDPTIEIEELTDAERKRLAEETRSNLGVSGEREGQDG